MTVQDQDTTRPSDSTAPTVRHLAAVEIDTEQYELRIIKDGTVTVRPLASNGEYIIGRADGCDIQIDKASVSRRHARLRIGSPATITDLASAKGVKIRDRTIPPGQETELAVGEVIEIYPVIMFLHHPKKIITTENVLDKEEYQKRLRLLFNRSSRKTSTFGVLRIRCKRWTNSDPLPVIVSVLKGAGLIGVLEPHMFDILLCDLTNYKIEKISQSVCKTLVQSGFDILAGQAFYPRDGRKPEALKAKIAQLNYLYGNTQHDNNKAVVVVNPMMVKLYETIEKIAPSNLNVLVMGETGVGKEVIAETVHNLSHRREQPLLRINCAAMPKTLLESELFGFERGAFTGAERTKIGLLEMANGGTVLLDEIGDMSLSLQVKLLRVLEERRIFRVGGIEPRKIDVRFIGVTNRNLWEATLAGTFRTDLYYRLNGVTLKVPPLRKRTDEIEPLASECIRRFCACRAQSPVTCVSPEIISCLRNHRWPGNIRELENVIEHALLMSGGRPIELEHLAIANTKRKTKGFSNGSQPGNRMESVLENDSTNRDKRVIEESVNADLLPADRFKHDLIDLERTIIIEALQRCAGNQTRAAKILGVSRHTLIKRLDEYKIEYGRRKKKSPQ